MNMPQPNELDPTKTVSYGDYRVTIRPATYRVGLTRTFMIQQARSAQGEPNPDDLMALAESFGRCVLWPSLIAPVMEHEGFEHWPITADEFLALPDPFVTEWEQAVYSLNPQWRVAPADEDAEKKAPGG